MFNPLKKKFDKLNVLKFSKITAANKALVGTTYVIRYCINCWNKLTKYLC